MTETKDAGSEISGEAGPSNPIDQQQTIEGLKNALSTVKQTLWKYAHQWESGWPGEMPMPGFEVGRILQREIRELLPIIDQALSTSEGREGRPREGRGDGWREQ